MVGFFGGGSLLEVCYLFLFPCNKRGEEGGQMLGSLRFFEKPFFVYLFLKNIYVLIMI
jgi:hypothetical protein